jgi:hypothetical protein
MIYCTLAFIVIGLMIFESRTRPRPIVTSKKALRLVELYLGEELSLLQSLKAQQDEYRSEKAQIYRFGDQRALSRRGRDGRFDARGDGKNFNEKLERLDELFEAMEDQILELEFNVKDRHQQQAYEFTQWRSKYILLIAFRSALAIYLVSSTFLATIRPFWFQELSQFLAQFIWLGVPTFAEVYGSLFVASCFSITTILVSQVSRPEFFAPIDLDALQEVHDQNIMEFMEPAEISEQSDTDEEEPEWENENDKDGQSPYAILGISPNSSRDEIVAAYRELVKQYHPDFQQNRGLKLRKLAEHETQLLNWAKEEALKHL